MTEAAELIARLRGRARQLDKAGDGLGYYSRADSMIEREAADHIETLEARVATLSAALARIEATAKDRSEKAWFRLDTIADEAHYAAREASR